MDVAKRKPIAYVIIILFVLAAAAYGVRAMIRSGSPAEVPANGTPSENDGGEQTGNSADTPDIETVAEGLNVPWEIVFLPGGDMLVTERPGKLRRLGQTPQEFTIEGVAAVGEGGLLGLALDPDFSDNGLIYVYLTARENGGLINRIERYRYDGRELGERRVILDGIPAGGNHDGGRLAFGPDGSLYVTTGDAGRSSLAQDLNSLAGKILRIDRDGNIPYGNPFDSRVWSYGHRNPQGLAWDAEGRLWSVEHGRSGVLFGYDEMNLIEPGKNYGWPTIQGDESRSGLERPVRHSGSRTTWAPAGLIQAKGDLLFTGLRGTAIYRSRLEGAGAPEPQVYWQGKYGRLRAITAGPDGYIYVSTSNRDGRGNPQDGDDKIFKVKPSIFGIGD